MGSPKLPPSTGGKPARKPRAFKARPVEDEDCEEAVIAGLASQAPQPSKRTQVKGTVSVEPRLQKELERLKAKLGLGGALTVAWLPGEGSEELGRVVGDRIEVYTEDAERALKTLRHEFLEYVLTHEYMEPRLFEAKMHRRADALVNILAELL